MTKETKTFSKMFSLNTGTAMTPSHGRFPASKQKKLSASDKRQANTQGACDFALFSEESM